MIYYFMVWLEDFGTSEILIGIIVGSMNETSMKIKWKINSMNKKWNIVRYKANRNRLWYVI